MRMATACRQEMLDFLLIPQSFEPWEFNPLILCEETKYCVWSSPAKKIQYLVFKSRICVYVNNSKTDKF